MFHQLQVIKDQIEYRYGGGVIKNHSTAIQNGLFDQLTLVFLNPNEFSATQFSKYSLSAILDYLQKTHIYYLEKCLNEISLSLSVLTYKGDYKKYLSPVLQHAFTTYISELKLHIDEEESDLFPYIRSLINAKESGRLEFSFEQKLMLINHLLHHTDEPEKKLRSLIELLEDKKEHFEDQLALNVLLSKLESFERDLLVHAKLEEQVLIPKALELEKEVLEYTDF
ncbi:MAG: hypothetical protein AAF149_09700 [Bacteroidota bacterium]